MDDLTILYPEPKKITISGRDFILKPMVIKQSVALLKLIGSAMVDFVKRFPDVDVAALKDNPNSAITPFIEVAGDRMKDIFAIILGVEASWAEENIDIKSGVKVLKEFLEMNDIPFLLAEVKGLTQLAKKQASAK